MAPGWEEMAGMLLLLVISAGTPVSGQTGSPGVFIVAKSCGGNDTGSPVALRQLVVNGKVWLRSLRNSKLQAYEEIRAQGGLQAHGEQDQVCSLPANVTFKVRHTSYLQVTNPMTSSKECQFPRNTVLQLEEGGHVLVSCRDGMEEAEREMMNGLPESYPATQPPMGSTTQPFLDPTTQPPLDPTTQPSMDPTTLPFVEPRARNLDLTASKNSRLVDKTTTKTPLTITDNVNSDTDVASTAQTTTTKPIVMTPKTVLDSSSVKMQSSDIALKTFSFAGVSLTSLNTESLTDAEVAHGPPTIALNAPTTGGSDNTSTHPHLQNIQASSSADEDHYTHSLPYFIGAGACVAVLIIGIIIVVCIAKHKNLKPKTSDNHEEFFISGNHTGSLNRLKSFESEEGKQGHDGTFNNAQIMYSSADVEYVESFEIEEKILKSETSTSDPEVPKCLR